MITTSLHKFLKEYDDTAEVFGRLQWYQTLLRATSPDEETIITLSTGKGPAPSIPGTLYHIWMMYHAPTFDRGGTVHPMIVCRWLTEHGQLSRHLWP